MEGYIKQQKRMECYAMMNIPDAMKTLYGWAHCLTDQLNISLLPQAGSRTEAPLRQAICRCLAVLGANEVRVGALERTDVKG